MYISNTVFNLFVSFDENAKLISREQEGNMRYFAFYLSVLSHNVLSLIMVILAVLVIRL